MGINLWEQSNFDESVLNGTSKKLQAEISKFSSGHDMGEISPTLILGLVTEVDCFKAIKEMGDAKFFLKKQLAELSRTGQKEKEVQEVIAALQQVHSNQLIVINDVCKRFHVIHPDLKDPTSEMREHQTMYWDWYAEQHYKVYGVRPEVLDKGINT